MGVGALKLDRQALDEVRERYGVRCLRVFGSVLGDRFGPESDIDVLAEFRPDQRLGFFRFMRLQQELSDLLGRPVDLHTAGSLSKHFRQEVLSTAEVVSSDAN